MRTDNEVGYLDPDQHDPMMNGTMTTTSKQNI